MKRSVCEPEELDLAWNGQRARIGSCHGDSRRSALHRERIIPTAHRLGLVHLLAFNAFVAIDLLHVVILDSKDGLVEFLQDPTVQFARFGNGREAAEELDRPRHQVLELFAGDELREILAFVCGGKDEHVAELTAMNYVSTRCMEAIVGVATYACAVP